MNAWAAIGRQLRCPSGFCGSLLGHLMGVANRASNRLAIRALNAVPCDTILELGFGSGRAIETLSSIASHGCVLGIDHSATMLKQASRRNRTAIRKGRVHLLRGRLDALPLRADLIDKILAVHVAYFLGAAELREARRVLRPGGAVIMLATDKLTMARWKFTQSSTHDLFGLPELAALLARGGFASGATTVRRIELPFSVPGLLAIATKQQ